MNNGIMIQRDSGEAGLVQVCIASCDESIHNVALTIPRTDFKPNQALLHK